MTSPLRVAILTSLLASACTSGGGSSGGTRPPTQILVDPQLFEGDVTCIAAPGGLQSYVATLVDVTPISAELATTGVVLPSSLPTPCQFGVAFDRVYGGDTFNLGNLYVADIQGYDRPYTTLRPSAFGSAVLLDSEGDVVPPRWTTSCGRQQPPNPTASGAGDAGAGDAGSIQSPDAGASGLPVDADSATAIPAAARQPDAQAQIDETAAFPNAVRAKYQTSIRVRPCDPWLEVNPPESSITGIEIDPARALAGLTCGDGPCEISTYKATVHETGNSYNAACDEVVIVDGLDGGQTYHFDIDAFRADDIRPRWTASCYSVARSGVTLEVTCDPIVSHEEDEGSATDAGTCL